MKKLLLAFLILSGIPLCAQTTTTYTGTIKDLTGATVTSGRITWQLNAPSGGVIPGTGAFVSSTVSCLINASGAPVSSADGTSACVITSNTSLTPTGTSYTICIQPYNATPGSCFVTYATGGTVNISTLVPTPATMPSYGVCSTVACLPISGGTLTGFLLAPIINYQVNASSYASLTSANAACPLGGGCTLVVSNLVPLGGNLTLPSTTVLQVNSPGMITTTGGTLTVNGTIVAGPYQIFTGSGTVAGLVQSRPEWFGGTTAAPFLAAYNAIASTGGDLLLQQASYVSPFNQSSGTIGTKSNMRFVGSGMGDFNALGTQVVGGTIIQGQMQINASNVQFKDMCIDDGSAVIAALFSGAIGNGLTMANSGSAPYKGIVLQNVCSLNSSNTASVHAILLENVDHLYASNLNTLFGTHGVILKGTHSNIVGIHARGHFSDGLIIKVDTSIPNADNSISDVHVESFNTLDTGLGGGGIVVNGGSGGTLAGLTITGATMRALAGPCISVGANAGTSVADMAISNVMCDTPGGSPAVGVWFQNLTGTIQRAHLSNISVNNSTTAVRLDSNAQDTQLVNIDATNAVDAINNNGGAFTQVSNARCSNCSGFTLNWVNGFGSQEGIEGYTGGGAFVATPWQIAASVTVNNVTFGSLTQGRGAIATGFQGGAFSGTGYTNTQTLTITTLAAAGSGGSFAAFACASATCSPNYGSLQGTMGTAPTTGDFVKVAWTGAALTHKVMCSINVVDATSLATFTGSAADTGNSSSLQFELYNFAAMTAAHTYVVNYICL